MGTASRRGAPKASREGLRELLSDPQQQLDGATECLLGRPVAVFETADGPVTPGFPSLLISPSFGVDCPSPSG
jgi:hypothetical protein